jgi:hypothetical protein
MEAGGLDRKSNRDAKFGECQSGVRQQLANERGARQRIVHAQASSTTRIGASRQAL